jgi:RimJ/RimL family protein N-acetyltransferase
MKFACETPSTGVAGAFALMLQGQLPTLATERLLLRAPRVDDFDAYAQIMETERGAYMGGPMSREDAWADFSNATANWLLHGHGIWTIASAGQIAGFVILGLEPGDLEPELGFMLLAPFEGQNIAFEAAQAARAYAFDTLGWTTLVSYVDPHNIRSRKLVARLGGLLDGDTDGTLIYRYMTEAQP